MNPEVPSYKAALARRAFLRLLGQGVTAAGVGIVSGALAGCGGGGSSRRGGSGGGTPTPAPTGTPTSGPLTPESRAATMQTINARMDTLLAEANVTDQQIVEYLKAQPLFEEAGSVKAGGAWARFTDGQVFIVSRNFAEPDPEKSRAFEYQMQSTSRAVGKELPTSDLVHVFNALGSAFTPPHQDISLWLVRHGYSLGAEREATIEALKKVGGDGVFYINSHGDYGKTRDGVELWALWTAEEATPEKDLLYKDLLEDGSLVRFSAIHNRAPIQNPFNDAIEGNYATHYAITKRFIEKFNWQFGQNSFVFMNCCWSADADWVTTCVNHKAATYAGWTCAANPPQAWRAARFVFDRMLGQLQGVNNEYPEPGGPQRAFDVNAVFADLRKRGWNKTQTSFGEGELIVGPNTSEFGLLAPTIQYVETDEFAKKLILHGQFGTDRGPGLRYVRMEGADLNVTKWEPERIEADLLPDQFGDVWVQVVARKSNIRQLTRWEGTFDYEAKGPQTLKQTAHIQYRFRADVGKFRSEPGGPLHDRQVTFSSVLDPSVTKARLAYTGEADLFAPDGENSFFTQWTGEGEVFANDQFDPLNTVVVRGTIDTATRTLRLEVLPSSGDIFKYRSYGKFRGKILGGFTDELRPIFAHLETGIFGEKETTNGYTRDVLAITFDESWALPAGNRSADAKPPTPILVGFNDGDIDKIPTRITWTATTAAKPPREAESRSRAAHR